MYDAGRYVSVSPPSGYRSTHIFEFNTPERPNTLDQLDLLWEGFANRCTQNELYIWDYVAGQWGDGSGLLGANRFVDNWAGNRDGYLTGSIGQNLDHFVDANGQITLMLYAHRTGDVTGHDYVAVTAMHITQTLAGDMNCDGVVNFYDINPFVQALSNPAGWQAAHPGCPLRNGDVNWDGAVNFYDINPFVGLLTGG